uniref:RdRp catalytic domain-containing protein n=1 Tax=viral metagenome TaxID=1070528 RepID=A0A2V0R9P7_9ZZZZ
MFGDNIVPKLNKTLDPKVIFSALNKRASSGLPHFKKKGQMLKTVIKVCDEYNSKDYDTIEKYFQLPAVVYRIVQPGKSGKFKNRYVYGPPIEVTIIELIFGYEVMNYFLEKQDSGIVLGKTQVELFNLLQSHVDKFTKSGDYSNFDQTIPSCFLLTCLDTISYMIKLDDDFDLAVYGLVSSYIVNCNLYHPVTGLVKRKQGIYSGSYFTNLLDSMVNCFIIGYTSALSTDCKIFVSGDDLFIVSSKDIIYREDGIIEIGMKLTMDKETVTTPGT